MCTNRDVNSATILVNSLKFKTLKGFLTIDLVFSFQNLRVCSKCKKNLLLYPTLETGILFITVKN